MKPWEVVKAFTEPRLVELARRILKIRYRALRDHRPDLGDGPWGLGTRVYERIIKQLYKASISGELAWLVVRLDGLAVSIKIDGFPIRLCRGPADNPSSKVLEGGLRDLEEVVEETGVFLPGFAPDAEGAEWFWVMDVETILHGTPIRVVVQQVSTAGETRNAWTVPVDLEAIQGEVAAEVDGGPPIGSMSKRPIEVEKATVTPKENHGARADHG